VAVVRAEAVAVAVAARARAPFQFPHRCPAPGLRCLPLVTVVVVAGVSLALLAAQANAIPQRRSLLDQVQHQGIAIVIAAVRGRFPIQSSHPCFA
jgi:hypothetical protein